MGRLPQDRIAAGANNGAMWQRIVRPMDLAHASAVLARGDGRARVVAGGTDIIVELSRRPCPDLTLVDISGLDEHKYVRLAGDTVAIGGLATHNDVLAAPFARRVALPLVQACSEVGAPQIRARATIAGNLATASPANDTIAPLIALDATLVLHGAAGERVVPIGEFYRGFRQTCLAADELIREIRFPALAAHRRGLFLKLGLRRAQAISVVDLAFVLTFGADGCVLDARIALGCLAPTVIRAPGAEAALVGRPLDAQAGADAAAAALADVAPIDDVRGSARYRREALAALIAAGLTRIADGREADDVPVWPVLLETERPPRFAAGPYHGTVVARINGERRVLPDVDGKTLMNALRDDAGLTGTKEGCAEGECGACTVWLDGAAVMSCLIPAAQAHGRTITTIEGLADGPELHPLQQAYIDCGAVQCGFCIPGMLMAGAKLLDERRAPEPGDLQTAISGNICRCTGYRKILDAMSAAADTHAAHEPRPAALTR